MFVIFSESEFGKLCEPHLTLNFPEIRDDFGGGLAGAGKASQLERSGGPYGPDQQ